MAKETENEEPLITVAIGKSVHDQVMAYRRKLDVGMGSPPIRRVMQALIIEGLSSFAKKKRPS